MGATNKRERASHKIMPDENLDSSSTRPAGLAGTTTTFVYPIVCLFCHILELALRVSKRSGGILGVRGGWRPPRPFNQGAAARAAQFEILPPQRAYKRGEMGWGCFLLCARPSFHGWDDDAAAAAGRCTRASALES